MKIVSPFPLVDFIPTTIPTKKMIRRAIPRCAHTDLCALGFTGNSTGKTRKNSGRFSQQAPILANPELSRRIRLTVPQASNTLTPSIPENGFPLPPQAYQILAGGAEIMSESEDRWLSVDEMGKHLGVSKDTVYRWINTHSMPAHRMGRFWKFKREQVDAWIEAGGATLPGEADETDSKQGVQQS